MIALGSIAMLLGVGMVIRAGQRWSHATHSYFGPSPLARRRRVLRYAMGTALTVVGTFLFIRPLFP